MSAQIDELPGAEEGNQGGGNGGGLLPFIVVAVLEMNGNFRHPQFGLMNREDGFHKKRITGIREIEDSAFTKGVEPKAAKRGCAFPCRNAQ